MELDGRLTEAAAALQAGQAQAAWDLATAVLATQPEQPAGLFRRNAARFKHLDELARRLKKLERRAGLGDDREGHDES